jgi:hypothetical protein
MLPLFIRFSWTWKSGYRAQFRTGGRVELQKCWCMFTMRCVASVWSCKCNRPLRLESSGSGERNMDVMTLPDKRTFSSEILNFALSHIVPLWLIEWSIIVD